MRRPAAGASHRRAVLASGLRRPEGLRWVQAAATALAALTWQMRFLPALLMLVGWLIGLRVRHRYPDRSDLLLALGLVLPLLPSVAVEVGPPPPAAAVEVVPGQAITVTDRMTIVLDRRGRVRFLPNERVRAQLLCPGTERVPVSEVTVRGWPVERTALDWMMPRHRPDTTDSRCSGRLEAR